MFIFLYIRKKNKITTNNVYSAVYKQQQQLCSVVAKSNTNTMTEIHQLYGECNAVIIFYYYYAFYIYVYMK